MKPTMADLTKAADAYSDYEERCIRAGVGMNCPHGFRWNRCLDGCKDWNPRYILYSRANGRTPEAQQAHDRATHPTGWMVPFITWKVVRHD